MIDKDVLTALNLTEEEYKEREKEFLESLNSEVKRLRYTLSKRITSWASDYTQEFKGDRNELLKELSKCYFNSFSLPQDFPITPSARTYQNRNHLENFVGAYLLTLTGEEYTPAVGTVTIPTVITIGASEEECLTAKDTLYNYLLNLGGTLKKVTPTLEQRLLRVERELEELKKWRKRIDI